MTSPFKKGARATLPRLQTTIIPNEIGKCINMYVLLVKDLGWGFFQREAGKGIFCRPSRLLRQCKHRGGTVILSGKEWTYEQWIGALDIGPNQSMTAHIPFLRENFPLMVGKLNWLVMHYLVYKELPGLSLIPTGVKEERYQRPRWLGDYSFSNLNSETLPISAMSSIQYVWSLERLIRQVFVSDPALGPVHVLKADFCEVFYRIGSRSTDATKIGLVFFLEGEDKELAAIPLTLPMWWKNSPPIF